MPDSEAQMHGQEPELDLLAALVPQLRERSMVDVGAEHGAVASALRAAGAGPVWMIEPFPGNASGLRERFASEPDMHVLEIAASARDGSADLHLAVGPQGEQMDAFHSLRPSPPVADLRWEGSVPVATRSLDSLLAAGELPGHVGLLKIDAEGSDADVLRGAATLDCELVMVEFWLDLPEMSGRCPYALEELCALVEPMGPRRFLFVQHGPHHASVGRWDVADPATGEWGNLIFVADSLIGAAEAALPALDRALTDRNERVTAEFAQAAAERLELIERLS